MSDELTLYRDQALMPTTFDGLMHQADVLVRSGMLPAEVKSPAAAVAIMLKGRELNIPPMQAFSSIYVVKGKPTVSAQLMGALIFRAGHSYHVEELTNETAKITFQRKGGKPYMHSFTIKDAEAAGLAGSETWKKYTKAMLFSRCMSAGARIAMPDVIAGMYTPEELADPDTLVVDTETGEVIDVQPKVVSGPMTTETTITTAEKKNGKPTIKWSTAEGREAFLDMAVEHFGLTRNTILHAALGLDENQTLMDYTGTMSEASATIEAWKASYKAAEA